MAVSYSPAMTRPYRPAEPTRAGIPAATQSSVLGPQSYQVSGSTKTSIVPPQASPTSKASSSLIP